MRRDRKEYNTQLIKKGEILTDPDILDTQSQPQQTKKLVKPFKYATGIKLTNRGEWLRKSVVIKRGKGDKTACCIRHKQWQNNGYEGERQQNT